MDRSPCTGSNICRSAKASGNVADVVKGDSGSTKFGSSNRGRGRSQSAAVSLLYRAGLLGH
jgi:hypothetical protein